MMMRTLPLVMLLIALPRLSYAAEDEGVSRALLDKISCKVPFSVAAIYLDMRAAGFIGPKFADYDSTSCFNLAKPLDLLGTEEAPIEYICFSDRHLFTALPDLFTRGPGTQSDFIAIGFTDKGEAGEYIWQDDGTEPPDGFFEERDPTKFFPSPVAPVIADAEWTCFPPSSVSGASFWKRYGNARFGYWIDIPPGFTDIDEAENGDGGISSSADVGATLSVWGSHILDDNFATEVKDRIKFRSNGGWSITYKKQGKEWASWSGTRGNRVVYQRAIFLCDDTAAYFSLEYDQAAISPFDPIVDRLASSLKPGGECALREP